MHTHLLRLGLFIEEVRYDVRIVWFRKFPPSAPLHQRQNFVDKLFSCDQKGICRFHLLGYMIDNVLGMTSLLHCFSEVEKNVLNDSSETLFVVYICGGTVEEGIIIDFVDGRFC